MVAASGDAVYVELVNGVGETVGCMSKLEAHQHGGQLHRAVSVVLFKGERLLLQRRALSKYHFAGYWANTCCSHPFPGESPLAAAKRTLETEMGIEADLGEVGAFCYRERDPKSGLVEYEYDHVFLGEIDDEPEPNPREISEIRWLAASEYASLDNVAPWLPLILDLLARKDGKYKAFANQALALSYQ